MCTREVREERCVTLALREEWWMHKRRTLKGGQSRVKQLLSAVLAQIEHKNDAASLGIVRILYDWPSRAGRGRRRGRKT